MKNTKILVFLILSLSISICNAEGSTFWTVQGCQIQNDNGECTYCQTGYELNASLECVYTATYCNQASSEVCTVKNCLVQEKGKCKWCVGNQYSQDGVCQYWCPVTNTYSLDLNSCNVCSPTSASKLLNCQFCYSEKGKCDLCVKGKQLYLGQCYDTCPEGTYKNGSACAPCHPRCKACKSQGICDSCVASVTTLANDCTCSTGALYRGKCISKCPYTYEEDKGCINKCKFPPEQAVFTEFYINGFGCRSIEDPKYNYCTQHLRHLSEFIEVTLEVDSNPAVHIVKVVLDETPHTCYTYKLLGKGAYQVDNSFLDSEYTKTTTNKRQTTLIYKIPHESFANDSLIEVVTGGKFVLHFQVFWLNQPQQTFNIQITQDMTGNLVGTKQYQVSSKDTESIACTRCSVEVSKVITSKLDLSCTKTDAQICTADSITAQKNTSILFTQIVTDPDYLSSRLAKQSLKFESDTVTYIEDYSVDTSTLGQITYKLPADVVKSGKLTVTSTIDIHRRLLDSSTGSEIDIHEIKYPQMIIYLNIISPFSSQLKEWMLYGMAIVIIFFIFKTLNKRAEKKEETIRNYEQLPKSVEIKMDE